MDVLKVIEALIDVAHEINLNITSIAYTEVRNRSKVAITVGEFNNDSRTINNALVLVLDKSKYGIDCSEVNKQINKVLKILRNVKIHNKPLR